jgi:hypothetical protein
MGERCAGVWLVCFVIAMPPAAHADPDTRQIGVGLLAGMSSQRDPLGGVRGVFRVADAGPGTLRAISQVLGARWRDPADMEHRWDVLAVSAALEYVAPVSLPFFIATGAGVGYDVVHDNYDHPTSGHAWGTVRISPTLNVGAFDVGLHVQLVYSDRLTVLGELGVDYFIN